MGRNLLAAMLVLALVASPMALPAAAADAGALVTIQTPVENEICGGTVLVTWATDPTVNLCRVWLDDDEVPGVGVGGGIELTGLSEGRHVLVVRAYNGTAAGVDSVVFFVDTTGPALTILSPAQGAALNTSAVTVRWSADDASTIARYEVEVRMNGQYHGDYLFNHSVSELTLTHLDNESYSVTVTAYDGAGKSTARTVSFYVDVSVPTIELLAPLDGFCSIDGDVDVAWMADDAEDNIQGFEVFLNGIKQTTVASRTFGCHFSNLQDGAYVVTVRAVDSANNTAQGSASFIVDTVPPEVVGTFPGEGAAIGTVVNATFSRPMDWANSTIAVDGVHGTLSWNGLTLTFTPDAPLAYGTAYHVSVAAKDAMGRWANATWTFTTTDMARLTGTVLDSNGNPLANATVAIVGGPQVLTDAAGSFRLEFHAGEHILTVSRPGYVTRNMPVSIAPGEERSMGEVRLSSSDLLPLVGWAVALAAVGLVALMYVVSRNRRRRPPARRPAGKPAARSWRGLEELEKRARRDRDPGEDLDDRGRL